MQKVKQFMKRGLFGITAMLLIGFYPANAFAAGSPSSATKGSGQTQGPTSPPGPDGKTYVYNEATGMWENDYYIWNPTTGQTTPRTPQKYSYNPDTGMWDTTEYRYNAPSGSYVPNVVSASQNPNPSPSTDDSTGTSTTTSNSGVFDSYYNAAISNKTSATALSGNAYVTANTTGGSAVSGDATAISNVINMLQSAGFDTGNMTNFSANIQGDVVGDLMIDPGSLGSASNAAVTNNNLAVNSQQTGAIKNVIDLNAGTGAAVVDSNTQGGSAISGNANAVANVVNMINSMVGSGQSFMGNINIMGNFNGDILLPQDFLDSLLSSNAPVTTLDTSSITNNNVLADLTTNAAISNNVGATATTGQADVANNTSAGNAQTGNANTNITVLNLTGSQVIGKNAMLVFVNVLGKWVGMIMNAPGATSGVVGGGVSQSNITNNNASLTGTANYMIDNDINVGAHSGNAGVTNNTEAGNAQTGNATASVNLANMLNSSFSLSDWFGVLFINVFGSWNGSFGVNTAAGDLPASPEAIAAAAQNPSNVKMFQFVPNGTDHKATLNSVDVGSGQSAAGTDSSSEETKPAVQAATTDNDSSSGTAAAKQMSWMVPFVALVVGGTLLGGDSFFGKRGRHSIMRFTRRGGIDFIEPLKSH